MSGFEPSLSSFLYFLFALLSVILFWVGEGG